MPAMAADEKIYPGGPALGWPASDLIDEVLFWYTEWRDEAAAVAETYRHWCAAPSVERDRRYGVYIAALDREQAAAMTCAIAASELRALVRRGDHLPGDFALQRRGDIELALEAYGDDGVGFGDQFSVILRYRVGDRWSQFTDCARLVPVRYLDYTTVSRRMGEILDAVYDRAVVARAHLVGERDDPLALDDLESAFDSLDLA
jgi:hypothetical protein